MGKYRTGPPRELILDFHQNHKISTFIETGSYEGDTAAWAANHFDDVYSIEYGRELYETAVERYGERGNCYFMYGDSREELPKIVDDLSGRALFWLDAHYSGGNTYGDESQCPLLGELEVISELEGPQYVLIDDARYFLRPPPEPYDVDDWPSLDEIVGILLASSDYHIVVVEDVIVCVPEHARQLVVAYCRSVDSKIDDSSSFLHRILAKTPGFD